MRNFIRDIAALFLMTVLLHAGDASASDLCPSEAALAGAADLIITGTVSKVSPEKGRAGMVASIEVERQLKGSCAPSIMVRYSYYPGMEPDSQDPNFGRYLKKNLLVFLHCLNADDRLYELRWGSCGCVFGDEARQKYQGVVELIGKSGQ